MTAVLYELHLDDSPESREVVRLLAEKGISVPRRMATSAELQEYCYPRLLTSEGTLIGLPHIRLVLSQ